MGLGGVRWGLVECLLTPLLNYFRTKGVGGVTADCEARTGAGRMRFRYHGALIYNECRSGRALGLP